MLTRDQLQTFDRDGFVIVRGLFTPEEVSLGERIGRADQALKKAGTRKDAQGGTSKIWLDSKQRADIYNAFAHSPRIVSTTEQILGGPVYLWHYKMMMKEPRVGGAWEWHQDYGYWYFDGCLFPRLLSCMIGINRATKANGCLQVLRGSHKLERITHGTTGEQIGADLERVTAAMQQLELVHVELTPGDALFFHCNLLHCSAQNHSDQPRWAFICCYNAMNNIPYKAVSHGEPIKLETWPDESILEIGRQQLATMPTATG